MNLSQDELQLFARHFPEGVVAIDVETTGLSPLLDSILEISAVKICGGKTSTFNHLINPEIPIPANTSAIHGIFDDMVQNAPTITTIIPSFLEFVENLPVIAHNARFDLGFIIFALHQLHLPLTKSSVYCSIKLARHIFPDMEAHRLGHLAKEFGIELTQHHRALDDAWACLKVFGKSLAKMEKEQMDCAALLQSHSYLFNVGDFVTHEDFELPEHLKILKEKVAKQEVVQIKYRGGTMKNEFRPVKPMSLLPMPDGNVLYALCLRSGTHKSFALRKITEVKVTAGQGQP